MSSKTKIKDLPIEERPLEKALKIGCSGLTDTELLAIILRCGTNGLSALDLARELLINADGTSSVNALCRISLEELKERKGIGPVKAVQIQSIAELSRRIAKTDAGRKLSFKDPASIAEYYMEDLRYEAKEIVTLLMLNTKSALIAEKRMTVGTVNTSLVSAREVFIEALRNQAVYIILLHNHPSGDPAPSCEDLQVTKEIESAGNIVGIRLVDHIIIGDRAFVSFRESGFLT